MRRLLSAVAVTGFLLTGMPAITFAQSGEILWGSIKPEYRLRYVYDFGGQVNATDRLRLKIPAKKLKMAVEKFVITYPKYYNGGFDTDEVEIKVGKGKGKKVAVDEVKWDKEGKTIEIYPKEAVPAGKSVELILDNVENADFPGTFNFHLLIQSPGDKTALTRYLGSYTITNSR